MKPLLVLIALIFSAPYAYAFQETEVPATTPPSVDGGGELGRAPLALPDGAVQQEEGTSITIPGIGKIGTLPKLDFGLELLYKEDDSSRPVDQLDDDGLSIKGRLKHNF